MEATMYVKKNWIDFIHELQNKICAAVEACDGKAKFIEDRWQREDGGGGITRVIANGDVFEKGGVNTSVVYGDVTNSMRKELRIHGNKWFACGLSLVLHPANPFVPTVHCNYRMFELYNDYDDMIDRWFGGGTDLTPYYLFEEDAVHFHTTYKDVCDKFDSNIYYEMKAACDDYFVNWHRNKERRGIGGIFYDYKKADREKDVDFWMNFGKACGNAFTDAYLPIAEKRKNTPYNEANKYWHERANSSVQMALK
ncbi:MAG TPA: coproporphyrinogen III oxidase, partial [Chitinophagaceae bacterium]|nr:coproporphyrinogen III oxidase [Chitinophagaceae bacterium]